MAKYWTVKESERARRNNNGPTIPLEDTFSVGDPPTLNKPLESALKVVFLRNSDFLHFIQQSLLPNIVQFTLKGTEFTKHIQRELKPLIPRLQDIRGFSLGSQGRNVTNVLSSPKFDLLPAISQVFIRMNSLRYLYFYDCLFCKRMMLMLIKGLAASNTISCLVITHSTMEDETELIALKNSLALNTMSRVMVDFVNNNPVDAIILAFAQVVRAAEQTLKQLRREQPFVLGFEFFRRLSNTVSVRAYKSEMAKTTRVLINETGYRFLREHGQEVHQYRFLSAEGRVLLSRAQFYD